MRANTRRRSAPDHTALERDVALMLAVERARRPNRRARWDHERSWDRALWGAYVPEGTGAGDQGAGPP